ncbi:MAG: AAA family ATPase [Bacteroides sp.]|nr:AAA family ATPase [Ruminococcus flavefaciens]MCM1555730.1 AAA family ATPase [Bacteroides sp.]
MAAKLGARQIEELITSCLPFTPTFEQGQLIESLTGFIMDFRSEVGFVLQGYAGTGKTSVVGALVKALPRLNINTVLLAPTGRAAKVLAAYSGQPAYTMHKQIYYTGQDQDGALQTSLRANRARNTLYIVDEASMIGEENSLLFDFFSYVNAGYRCRVLLLGDTAQLPPVGSGYSPALDIDYLRSCFPIDFRSFCLQEVIRQGKGSLVLENATQLRGKTARGEVSLPLFSLHYPDTLPDLKRIGGEDLEECLQNEYGRREREDIVFITCSNKRANMFNNEIRARIFGCEGDLSAGDLLMILKNNYFWIPKESDIGFLANGDTMEVLKVKRREERYGFRFADIEARLVDYPDQAPVEVKVILDSLDAPEASLPYPQVRRLYEEVMQDYAHIPTKGRRMQAVKEDPFFNALQVKYAYALTCHKTQGGQWPCVFVEQGYFTDDMLTAEYLRWLYTALTRTTQTVYLLNFSDKFFTDEDQD